MTGIIAVLKGHYPPSTVYCNPSRRNDEHSIDPKSLWKNIIKLLHGKVRPSLCYPKNNLKFIVNFYLAYYVIKL